LAAGTDVNAKGFGGWTPLHFAAFKGHKEIVELLIAKGAVVDAMDYRDWTPLHWAACNYDKEIVELLIVKGANVNTKTRNGRGITPLDMANDRNKEIQQGDRETADLLRKHDGKTAKELRTGMTLLHIAAQEGKMETIALLIAKGANVNAKDEDRWIPLHVARTKEVAKLLIAEGADVNAKDWDGVTPLHRAAINGHKEVVELLIANGADVNAMSETFGGEDKTALDWAVDQDHTGIADLLRKHGGKTGEELKAEGK
jgi:ankyrin repeat protein